MSLLSRLRGKRDGGEENSRVQSPPTRVEQEQQRPISVPVPPKPSMSASSRANPLPAGGSLFHGMNFGEGASAAPKPDNPGDAVAAEAQPPSHADGLNAKDGDGDAAPATQTSAFSFLTGNKHAEGGTPRSTEPVPDAGVEVESGFSFIQQSDSASGTHGELAVQSDLPSSSSPFSFLSSGPAPVAADVPPEVLTQAAPSSQPETGTVATAFSQSSNASPDVTRASELEPLRSSPQVARGRDTPPVSTPHGQAELQPKVADGSSPAVTPSSAAKKKKKTRAIRPGYANPELDVAVQAPRKSPSLSKTSAGSRDDVTQPVAPGSEENLSKSSQPSHSSCENVASESSRPSLEPSIDVGGSRSHTTPSKLHSSSSSVHAAGESSPSSSSPSSELPGTGNVAATEKPVDECLASGTAADTASEPGQAMKPELNNTEAISKEEDGHVDNGATAVVASDPSPSSVDPATVAIGGGDGKVSTVEVSPVVNGAALATALSPSTQPEEEMSVYDIQLNVQERLDLRLQSEWSQLADIQADLQSTENQLLEFISSQLASQRQRLKKRCTAAELRKLETDAIAQENYVEAEKHSAKLKEIDDQLSSQTLVARPVDKMVDLNKQRDDLIQSQCTVQRDSVTVIQALLKEQQAEEETHQQQTAATLSKQRQEISDQREALVRDQSHLEVDWDLFRRSDEKLQGEEESKTSEFRERRQQLSASLQDIQNEISELEERLQKLRQRGRALEEDIEREDSKIEDVRRDMAEQSGRLSEQRRTLQAQQDSLDKKKEEVAVAEEAVEKLLQALTDQQERFQEAEKKMTSIVDGHSRALESSSGDVDAVKAFLVDDTRPQLTTSSSLTRLKDTLAEKQAEADAVTRKLSVSQKEVANLRKRLSDIDNQLPDLDDAKKLAVSDRDYREAQRLKQEQERLTAERTGTELELEEERQKLSGYNAQLKQVQDQLGDIRKEYRDTEEECDTETVAQFAEYCDRLQEVLIEQASTSSASLFLARLFRAELCYCQVVCAELLMKHGKPVPSSLLEDADEPVAGGSDGGRIEAAETLGVVVETKTGGAESHSSDHSAVSAPDEGLKSSLEAQVAELEETLAKAVAEEDYDRAGDVDIELSKLRSELSALS